MASHSYMSITGKRQGMISAGCSGQSSIGNKCQFGHQDEIMVLDYSHDMVAGMTAASPVVAENTCL